MKLHTLHEDHIRALILLEADDLMTRIKKRAMARAKPMLQQMTKQAQTKKYGYEGDTEAGPGKALDDVDVKATNKRYAELIAKRAAASRQSYKDTNAALYNDIKSKASGDPDKVVKPDTQALQGLWDTFKWVAGRLKGEQLTFIQMIHWLDKSIADNTQYNLKRIRDVLSNASKSGTSLNGYKELESAQTSLLSGLTEMLIRMGVNESVVRDLVLAIVECRYQSSNNGI